MDKIKQETIIFWFIIALIYGAICGMTCLYIQQGCHHCPVCPEIRDSTRQAPACTLYVPRVAIKQRIDTIRATDTLLVHVTRNDTTTTATIDTVASDGAKIGIIVRARLIIPPISASIIYTPPPDTVKNHIYHDTVTVRKTSWTGITIGTLGGVVVGVAGAAVFTYLLR